MYKSEGNDYEMVCDAIGWDKTIKPVEVMRKEKTVYCTGTLLKPNEWGELQQFNGKLLPDGSNLKITSIPKSL